jgi:hypothetical protein
MEIIGSGIKTEMFELLSRRWEVSEFVIKGSQLCCYGVEPRLLESLTRAVIEGYQWY